MQNLRKLAAIWPRLDVLSQDDFKDFLARSLTSSADFSSGMSQSQLDSHLATVDAELGRRVAAAEADGSLDPA